MKIRTTIAAAGAAVALSTAGAVVLPAAASAHSAPHRLELAAVQKATALPAGTTLNFSATTSFTDSCSSVWLASPGCSAPNWAGELAYGPANVSYKWMGQGTLTSSDPINAQGQGSAPLTESNIAINGSSTWDEQTASCQITATAGVASTGNSTPSTLKASLTPITSAAGVVSDFQLLMSLAYPPGGGGPGPAEVENWSWVQTATPSLNNGLCISGSFPQNNQPDGNAGQAVYGVANFDGDINATGQVKITAWTINPSWNKQTGGVWATKTIDQTVPYNYLSDPSITDQGTITVAETFEIKTTPSPPAVITLSKTAANVGDSVRVSGSGFAPGAVTSIFWDRTSSTALGTSDASSTGTVSIAVQVPQAAGGTHTVIATDSAGHRASAPITVRDSLTLTPSTANPRATVKAIVAGFPAANPVSIRWGSGSGRVLASGTTSSLGGLVITFRVPATQAGTYHVYAAGGSKASATLVVS